MGTTHSQAATVVPIIGWGMLQKKKVTLARFISDDPAPPITLPGFENASCIPDPGCWIISPRLLDNLTTYLEATRQTWRLQPSIWQMARREGSGMFVVSYSLFHWYLKSSKTQSPQRGYGFVAIIKQTNNEAGIWVRGTVFFEPSIDSSKLQK